jgi:hypothetical protein
MKYFMSFKLSARYSADSSAIASKRIFLIHMIRFVIVKCIVKNDANTSFRQMTIYKPKGSDKTR